MQADKHSRGEWVLKRKAQQIAEATARVGAAKRQKSAATDPAVAVRWEEELRQAAAEEAELIEERALFLEMMMEAPGAFEGHLQKNHACRNISDYLVNKYRSAFGRAHKIIIGYPGCRPVSMHSPDQPLNLPVEPPLREEFNITIEAAVYCFAEIEQAWMCGMGDNNFRRSTGLMTITGISGCETTSALLQLIPRIYAYMKEFPDRVLKLVEAAAPDCTRKQHSTTLQRLWASVQEGRQLVCWLSMDKHSSCLRLETERGPANAQALRLLYGFISHPDGLTQPSAAGAYQDFLADMDAAVRVRLLPEHVYDAVERLTATGGSQHCFFLLLNDCSSVLPGQESKAYALWAQQLLSTHLNWMHQVARGDRLVVPILGATRQTHAELTSAGSVMSRAAQLPLAPSSLTLTVQ